jgi:hypothetical protein
MNTPLCEITTYESLPCKHFSYELATNAITKLLSFKDRKPKGLLITGPSGVGKTYIAEQTALSLQSPTTESLSPKAVIYLDASLYSSVGDALSQILLELGDPTPYQGTIGNKENRACKLLHTLQVKLLIIDEVQDFLPKKGTTPNSKVYKFLKSFLNKCKVPFLLLGTENSETLFADDQLRTRFLPTQFIPAFTCYGDVSMSNFALLIEAMTEKLPRKCKGLKFCDEVTLDNGKAGYVLKKEHRLLLRLCLATKGLMRLTSDLLTECIVLTKPDETVDIKVLEQAYNNVINSELPYNPFDTSIKITKIKNKLIEDNLYVK